MVAYPCGRRGPTDTEKTIANDIKPLFDTLLESEKNPITLARLRGQAAYLTQEIARAMANDSQCIMMANALLSSVSAVLLANGFTVYVDPNTQHSLIFMVGVDRAMCIACDR